MEPPLPEYPEEVKLECPLLDLYCRERGTHVFFLVHFEWVKLVDNGLPRPLRMWHGELKRLTKRPKRGFTFLPLFLLGLMRRCRAR